MCNVRVVNGRFGSPGGILIRTGHTARAGASRRNHSNQHRQRRYFHVSWRDLTYPPPSRCRNAACRFGNLNDHCGRRSGCARPPWPILYRAGSLASGLPPELKRELRQKLVDAIVASVVKSPIVFVIVDTIVASVVKSPIVSVIVDTIVASVKKSDPALWSAVVSR